MTRDPALEAIHEARRQISREFGNDPARLIARYRQMESAFGGRIRPGPDAAQQGVAPDGSAPSLSVGRHFAG